MSELSGDFATAARVIFADADLAGELIGDIAHDPLAVQWIDGLCTKALTHGLPSEPVPWAVRAVFEDCARRIMARKGWIEGGVE